MTIYDRQEDVSPFYNSATIVINLTNPEQAVETFGLTPLEAMANGLPVIVPTIGGIAEMVENGVNGYKTNVKDLAIIQKQLQQMLGNKSAYDDMANKALNYSSIYQPDKTINSLIHIIEK